MTAEQFEILWVEDRENHAGLFEGLSAAQGGASFKVVRAGSLEEAPEGFLKAEFKIAPQSSPAIIVLDLSLPEDRMLEILSKIHAQAPLIPIIVLGDTTDARLAVESLRCGAQEYLAKDSTTCDMLVQSMQVVLERRRLDLRRNEALSIVSHELRSPIAIVQEGLSQVLEGYHGQVTDGQRRFLSITAEHVGRLRRLVDEMLDSSRLELGRFTLKRSAVSLGELVQKVALSFLPRVKEKGLELVTELPQLDREVYADADRITQVLTNLVGNAIKFTDKGRVAVRLESGKDEISCSVIDTGRGIAEQDLKRAFGKFQQFGPRLNSAERGLGLGLAISKGILELHEGALTVESLLGQGSKFTFTLPVYSSRRAFLDYMNANLTDRSAAGENLSVIIFGMKGAIPAAPPDQAAETFFKSVEALVRTNLRGEADMVFDQSGSTLAVLNGTAKQDALAVAERIRKVLDDALSKASLQKGLDIHFNVVSFPEDAPSPQEFIKKATL